MDLIAFGLPGSARDLIMWAHRFELRVAFGKADHDIVTNFEPRSNVGDEPGRGIQI